MEARRHVFPWTHPLTSVVGLKLLGNVEANGWTNAPIDVYRSAHELWQLPKHSDRSQAIRN